MQVDRRDFLKGLGLGAIAAPLLAASNVETIGGTLHVNVSTGEVTDPFRELEFGEINGVRYIRTGELR